MNKIEFEGSQNTKLAARLDRPSGRIKAYALFAHCFTCGKDIAAASRIAKALTNDGIAVLRFDFTGLGKSEGEFANTNFTSNVQDLIKAADYMRKHLEAPSILIGHSLGGAAVLAAAHHIPESKAIVTIGAPSDADHVTHHFGDKEAEIIEKGEAEVSLAGRPFRIRKQFLDDIKSQNIETAISDLDRALLVLHAPLDNIVSIDNAAQIFKAAKHPKSFVTLDDADHLISRKENAAYAARVIAAWVSRYIDSDPVDDEATKLNKGTVIVRSTGEGKFQQSVITGEHKLLADEPESHGGNNTGPTPYDFLKIAMGACKSMTLRMYADRKNLPLDGVEVYVTHDKIHAEDCADCETKDGKIDQFSCEIIIKGAELTDENRKRLIEIADMCPVHKTLSNKIIINSKEKT